MLQEFDLCGKHVPYEKITDYNIVQREYIYRPSFRERPSGLKKMLASSKYSFDRMLPYAMILFKDDMDFKRNTKGTSTKGVKEAVVKDLAVGALSILGDKINRKRFKCKNIAGRCFTTFLSDIPTMVIMNDGRIVDVYKNDSLYKELNQTIEPTIQMIPALRVLTKEQEYFFFGAGVQIMDVEYEYNRLKYELAQYREEIARLEAVQKPTLESGSKNPFAKLFGKKKKQPALEEKIETTPTTEPDNNES